MIKKLLFATLSFIIFLCFITVASEKVSAQANNCQIITPAAYGELSSSIDFLVENTSGLSTSNNYRIFVSYGSNAFEGIFEGCFDIIGGWACRYNEPFKFSGSGTNGKLKYDCTGTTCNINFSNLYPMRSQVGPPGSVQQNYVKIIVSSGTDPNNTTLIQCPIAQVPVHSNLGNQSCDLEVETRRDSNGVGWKTNSILTATGRSFTNAEGPFKILVWPVSSSGNPIGEDPPVIMPNITKSAIEAGVTLNWTGGTNFDPGDYRIYLLNTHAFFNKPDQALCKSAPPFHIDQAGSDAPPTEGTSDCKYCPLNSFVSGDNPWESGDSDPVCANSISPVPTNCDAEDYCNPALGCITAFGSLPNSEAPYYRNLVNVCPGYQPGDKECSLIPSGIGDIKTSVAGFTENLLGVVLSLIGGLALLLIIISGYRIMSSQGNPEALQAAREQLTAAIVGLLFVIFSLVVLEVIGVDILKLPGLTR